MLVIKYTCKISIVTCMSASLQKPSTVKPDSCMTHEQASEVCLGIPAMLQAQTMVMNANIEKQCSITVGLSHFHTWKII